MQRNQTETHIDSDRARSGSTPHIVRYVLGISLLLAILALSAIWITGAAVTDEAAETAQLESTTASTASGV